MQTKAKAVIWNNVVNLQPIHNIFHKEMKNSKTAALLLALALAVPSTGVSDDKVVPIKYGNMDQWVVRHINESGIIGGNTKTLYEIGPNRTINGNKAYKNLGGSPWGTSNVMAKVMGVVKTNNSVYRERRGSGQTHHSPRKRQGVRTYEHQGTGCRIHIPGRHERTHNRHKGGTKVAQLRHTVYGKTKGPQIRLPRVGARNQEQDKAKRIQPQ